MNYKDLSDSEKSDMVSILDTTQDPKERKIEGYGLCGTCEYFHLTKTEFKVVRSKCTLQNFSVSIEEPTKFCNNYKKAGEMSLYEMSQIALFINLEDEKERAGF